MPAEMRRRHLLVLAIGSTAAACDPFPAPDDVTYSESGECPEVGGAMLGVVADFPLGTWTRDLTHHVIVAHDARGLYAYSTICTHQGCDIAQPRNTGDTYCACHGSRYDGTGLVLEGPAMHPLPHHALSVCGGAVFVDTSRVVDPSTRVPV